MTMTMDDDELEKVIQYTEVGAGDEHFRKEKTKMTISSLQKYYVIPALRSC